MRSLDRSERVWCLSGINLFRYLSAQQMEALHRFVKTVRYRKGETIFFPGDPSEYVYFLHDGRVRLAYLDESGKRMTLSICNQGEPFGEMALAGEDRRSLMAEALEDAVLCLIRGCDFYEFSKQHPEACVALTRIVGTQVHRLESRLTDLVFKDVPTRLARLLVRLGEDYGVPTSQGVLLDIRLTHNDLANLIGSTRETVTLTLNKFVKQGLLARKKRRLVLQDAAGLRQQAQLD